VIRTALASMGVALAAALAGCGAPRAAEPPARAAPSPAPTAAAAPGLAASARTPWIHARAAEGLSLLEAPAVVLAAPGGAAAVAPPFRGRVVRVAVRAGERVSRGQIVAEIVMPEVIQAASNHVAATTRLEAYARRKEQLQALEKDGLVKLSDLLESETRLAEARADQQTALGTLRAADLGAESAARLVEGRGQVALRSPIDGVVVEVKAALGETRDGAGEPLARIAADGETRVEARLSHAPPAGARYELLTPSGERHDLLLVGRAPIVDPRDGTSAAWFAAATGARLPAGLSGRLIIHLAGAAAVPARAIAQDANGTYVVARRGAAALRAAVEVLATSGADALVRGAVAPGDEVAADAVLVDGGSGT
jgi:cobalt-zinc-cadmium efflux system membrane fusion protein